MPVARHAMGYNTLPVSQIISFMVGHLKALTVIWWEIHHSVTVITIDHRFQYWILFKISEDSWAQYCAW